LIVFTVQSIDLSLHLDTETKNRTSRLLVSLVSFLKNTMKINNCAKHQLITCLATRMLLKISKWQPIAMSKVEVQGNYLKKLD